MDGEGGEHSLLISAMLSVCFSRGRCQTRGEAGGDERGETGSLWSRRGETKFLCPVIQGT